MEQRFTVSVSEEMTPDLKRVSVRKVREGSPDKEKTVQEHRVERTWLVWGTQKVL